MKNRNKNTSVVSILITGFTVFCLLGWLIDTFPRFFRIPSLSLLKYQFTYYFYNLVVKNPLSIVFLVSVLIIIVLIVFQRIEHSKLERETDFIQAEHLCKSGDESMQGYADAAEIRLQKQNKISAEKYGKRAPKSRYYNK